MSETIRSECSATWSATGGGWKLILTLAGTEVSSLEVVTRHVRIGGSRVLLGGIGDVYTVRRHRRKGYASHAMRASIEWMGERGYDVSVLFGISDYYDRFGYEAVFARSAVYVTTANLLRAHSSCTVRAARRRDGEELLKLYHHLNRYRSGTAIRNRDWGLPKSGLVAVNSQGRIVGYASVRSKEVVVLEMGGRTDDALMALAAAVGRRALRKKQEEVRLWLPEDHAFGRLAADLGCRWEIAYPRNEGAMGRIIDLQQLMKKLCPGLGKRVKQLSGVRRQRLSLRTDIGSVGLDVSRNGVEMCRPGDGVKVTLPQTTLTQLILGYRSVDEVAYRDDVRIPGQARPLLSGLFPKGCPYMWNADRY